MTYCSSNGYPDNTVGLTPRFRHVTTLLNVFWRILIALKGIILLWKGGFISRDISIELFHTTKQYLRWTFQKIMGSWYKFKMYQHDSLNHSTQSLPVQPTTLRAKPHFTQLLCTIVMLTCKALTQVTRNMSWYPTQSLMKIWPLWVIVFTHIIWIIA